MNVPSTVVAAECWRAAISVGAGHATANAVTIYAPRASEPVGTVVVILNTMNPTISGTTVVTDDAWHHVGFIAQ